MQTTDHPSREESGSVVVGTFRRHRGLVLGGAVVGLVLGILFSLVSSNTYTAESRLLVGSFEAPSAAIPGYVLASQTVAGNYARLASSTTVRDKLSEELGVPADEAAKNITVTAIPDSAVIRVTATAGSADDARTAAEAMANALNSTVEELNVTSSGETVLQDYRAASEALAAAKNGEAAAGAALTTAQAAGVPTSQAVVDAQAALASAQLEVATAQLKVDGLATQYKTQQETVSTSSRMRVLGGAQVSENSTLLALASDGLIGLAVGVVIGFGLGWSGDRRRRARPDLDDGDVTEPAEDVAPVGAER